MKPNLSIANLPVTNISSDEAGRSFSFISLDTCKIDSRRPINNSISKREKTAGQQCLFKDMSLLKNVEMNSHELDQKSKRVVPMIKHCKANIKIAAEKLEMDKQSPTNQIWHIGFAVSSLLSSRSNTSNKYLGGKGADTFYDQLSRCS